MTAQPHDWQDLTPTALIRFARRWTIKSWLLVIGILLAVASASWSAGFAYRAGTLPDFVYALEDPMASPLVERQQREDSKRFEGYYGDLVDWQKLRAIAASVAKDAPDGLTSEFEIVASLLAQVRATRGEAHFLAGGKDHIVRLKPVDGAINLEWEEAESIVRRIARDAGYELSEDDLRTANSNLNWAQFTYLDDEMQHAVIYRNLDGTLTLTINQP